MKKLIRYLSITFGMTWVLWWGDALLVALTPMQCTDVLPMILFTLGGFGPTISACLCLEGKFTFRKLWQFLTQYRQRGVWYVLAFAVAEVLLFVVSSNGLIDSIPQSPIALIVGLIVFLQAVVMYGGNEEWGWRGTMQPILQQKLPYPIAILVVGAVWVSWHIPLWFIQGDSHQSMSFISFTLLGLCLSYWLSAIYNATRNLLFCMAFHGLTNTMMGIFAVRQDWIYFVGLLVLTVIAVFIGMKTKDPKRT